MSQGNIKLLHKIDEIATDNSEYGYRFIYEQLKEDGYAVSKNRVLKYMGILGIQAIYPTKKKLTSIKNKEHKIYGYLLKNTGLELIIQKLFMFLLQTKYGAETLLISV